MATCLTKESCAVHGLPATHLCYHCGMSDVAGFRIEVIGPMHVTVESTKRVSSALMGCVAN